MTGIWHRAADLFADSDVVPACAADAYVALRIYLPVAKIFWNIKAGAPEFRQKAIGRHPKYLFRRNDEGLLGDKRGQSSLHACQESRRTSILKHPEQPAHDRIAILFQFELVSVGSLSDKYRAAGLGD